MCKYYLDDKFDQISSSANNLYIWLHILKSYTQEKGITNQQIANIDLLMEKIIEEVNILTRCI